MRDVLARTSAPSAGHHVPGTGYIVVGVICLIVGFILGRLWDELVGQALDVGAAVRRWFEVAGAVCLAVVVVGLIVWAFVHWGHPT